MVQTWISLRNDRIGAPCVNRRVTRIFLRDDVRFYGDYDLDIYLATRNEYPTLEAVVAAVIRRGGGWVSCCPMTPPKEDTVPDVSHCLWEMGRVPETLNRKFFPRKELYDSCRQVDYRNDGNFILRAAESSRFFYVFCWATS
jgi:hypothetical protein